MKISEVTLIFSYLCQLIPAQVSLGELHQCAGIQSTWDATEDRRFHPCENKWCLTALESPSIRSLLSKRWPEGSSDFLAPQEIPSINVLAMIKGWRRLSYAGCCIHGRQISTTLLWNSWKNAVLFTNKVFHVSGFFVLQNKKPYRLWNPGTFRSIKSGISYITGRIIVLPRNVFSQCTCIYFILYFTLHVTKFSLFLHKYLCITVTL